MSQEEVYKILEKSGKKFKGGWMTSKEIVEILASNGTEVSTGCVSRALNQMFKWNEVLRKTPPPRNVWSKALGSGPFRWKAK